jgi:hypothetical protein
MFVVCYQQLSAIAMQSDLIQFRPRKLPRKPRICFGKKSGGDYISARTELSLSTSCGCPQKRANQNHSLQNRPIWGGDKSHMTKKIAGSKHCLSIAQETPREVITWPIDKLVLYARNPRKNDAAVDRMCDSIREFGFKIPCLVRSDGEVIDGHLRLKAARKLGIPQIPVILCDEWTLAQVKAFRIMVNRSATWAEWDDELLKIELLNLDTSGYDLSLTGFDMEEIDALILDDAPDEDAVPLVPSNPVSCVGDLWQCGSHRVLCGDATDAESVSRLLGELKPLLLVVDAPYGIELDSELRDRAKLNKRGPAEPAI